MSDTHVSVRMSPSQRSKLKLASEVAGRRPSDLIREAVEEKCEKVLAEQPLSVLLKDYIGAVASEEPGNARRSREVMEEILDEKHPRRQK